MEEQKKEGGEAGVKMVKDEVTGQMVSQK